MEDGSVPLDVPNARQPSAWLWIGMLSGLSMLLCWTASFAQVTTTLISDGTLGTNVTQNGHVYEITSGTRPAQGPNLYHSFGRFDVGSGDTAHFISAPGIDNIIGRVTGPEASRIDGTLQAAASLFFLNPRGVIFGPRARLDINGSFHTSTADVLRFVDGSTLSTRLSEKSTLTVASPSAFGFLRDHPAGIEVQGGALSVAEGKNLAIVSGDIAIVGDGDPSSGTPNLSAPGGRITLASVASSGDVVLNPGGELSTPDMTSFAQLGAISMSEGARLDVSGEGGGTIVIRSGQLRIDSSQLAADTLGSVDGDEVGIDIAVNATFVIANGGLLTANVVDTGNAGKINIVADELRVDGGAQIRSVTSGRGAGGTVTVRAGELTLEGTTPDSFSSGIFSVTTGDMEGAGHAGAIVVVADHIRFANGAQIGSGTSGRGNGGIVTVRATEMLLEGDSADGNRTSGILVYTIGQAEGSGDAGDILLEAEQVSLSRGALIGGSTSGPGHGGDLTMQVGRLELLDGFVGSAASGTGAGGEITITAHDEIRLASLNPDELPGVLFSVSDGSGNPGRIRLMAPSIVLDGGIIGTAPLGRGRTADIELKVEQLSLTNSGLIAGITMSDIAAGTITICATDTVSLSTGGILTTTSGTGNAGNIVMDTTHVRITEGGRIDSSTLGLGNGGTVAITAMGSVTIAGRDSGIFTSTEVSGVGGKIELQAQRLQLTDEAMISSASSGSGDAGDMRIAAQEVELHGDSLITTTVDQGEASGGRILLGGAINDDGDVVEASARLMLERSRITANTDAGDGANMVIGARQVVLDSDSEIAANANAGVGGNVTIAGTIPADGPVASRAETIVLRHSKITANAEQGKGGRIDIVAETFLADPGSLVDASSQEGGIDGEVNVEAVVTNLSEVVRPLSQRLASASPLLRDRCAARLHEGLISSFVERERAGIPSAPDGLLPSRLDAHSADMVSTSESLPQSLVMDSDLPWRFRSHCP